MNLGAHVSIAGGLENCFERGENIVADAIQIFTHNPTQWNYKEITDEESKAFIERWKRSSIKKVIAHDSYLINLANPNDSEWNRAVDKFTDEIKRAEILSIKWVVTHPGSLHDSSEVDGIKRVARALNESFKRTKGYRAGILLETTSGQGTSLGWKFEHLKGIIENVNEPSRVGVCFDTAHAFAAGYDIRRKDGFGRVMRKFSKVIGIKMLKAMHLNDSMKGCGSRVDRHANIGKGEIGEETFEAIVNRKSFVNIPLILETPGGDTMFQENLRLLRSMKNIDRLSA